MIIHMYLPHLRLPKQNRLLNISFLLFFLVISSIAVENVFLDPDFSADDAISVALDPSSFDVNHSPIINDGDSAFTTESSPILGENLSPGVEPPMFDGLNEDDYGSLNLALDDTCSSGSNIINKRRIKSRDGEACEDKSPSVYLPENFRDLSGTLQAKIFQDFMCPSSRFEHTYIPVCSSPHFDDTQMLGYLTGNAYPIHYTLFHSSQMTWVDAWACSLPSSPYCCLVWTPDFVNDEYGPRLLALGTGVVCYDMTSTLDIFRSIVPAPR